MLEPAQATLIIEHLRTRLYDDQLMNRAYWRFMKPDRYGVLRRTRFLTSRQRAMERGTETAREPFVIVSHADAERGGGTFPALPEQISQEEFAELWRQAGRKPS